MFEFCLTQRLYWTGSTNFSVESNVKSCHSPVHGFRKEIWVDVSIGCMYSVFIHVKSI